MGQKVHPTVFRLGVNQNWEASWFATKRTYSQKLISDLSIRKYLETKLKSASLESVYIKRFNNKIEVEITVARPGVVIGRGGAGIEQIKKELNKMVGENVDVKVYEVRKPEISAEIIAANIVGQLENRVVPKYSAQRAIEAAKNTQLVKGVRIWVSGRIKGAEIARTEKFQWGTVPLQTIRGDIDYALHVANVPNAGLQGVKVWVYKGEKFAYDEK